MLRIGSAWSVLNGTGRAGRKGRSVSRLRPAVVELEDRRVPAVISFADVNDWGTGFQGSIAIQNNESAAIGNWRLEFDFAGQISQIWDGTIASHVGNHYVVTNAGYNASIAVGATTTFGFLGSPGKPTAPTNYLINGRSPGGGGGGVTPTSLSVADTSVTEGNSSSATTGFLSTRGNQIVDSLGNPVRISGVNWFGFETPSYAPHGLWARSYQSMMDQMKQLGYNTIRLPFSNQLFDPGSTPNGIDYSKNPDLAGLSGPQIMDKIVAYAGQIGLKIILDDHRSDAGGGPNGNGLWYTAAYPEGRWISDWVNLAKRYAGNPAVIGADLMNEPHGAATWGDGSLTTDWRLAAERAGNAIIAANPNWLIVVEGIDHGPSGNDWWGGNLSAAGTYPVVLSSPGHLVYSPHDYPSSVYAQPWFSAPNYPNNLPAVWDANWGYLYRQNVAPIMLGEFGTKLQTASDRQWLTKLVQYLGGDFNGNGTNLVPSGQYGPSWTYWSWNPDSGDTGGVLADDWQTVNQAKVDAVKPVQFGLLGAPGTSATSINFTVTLSVASAATVTVGYTTVDGTATAGTDYVATMGTLTFAPGELTKVVSVPIIPDTAPEATETMYLKLASPVNATITRGQATGTIVDSVSNPPVVLPTLSVDDQKVTEGASGTTPMTFHVRLSAASATPVTVAYATSNGSAVAGTDFVAASGTLTFAPGETAKTVTVNVVGDSVYNPDETFYLNLSAPAGATLARAIGVGTIVDNLPPPPAPPAIGFAVTSSWSTGFNANVTVRNTTAAPIADWLLEFDAPFSIVNIWNASIVSHVGTHYRLHALSYNAAIAPGASVSFGFQADGSVGSGLSNVTLNGVKVTVG